MSKLRNDLIGKIKKMPEKWFLFINGVIDSLSEHSKNSVYDSHINVCPYCGGYLVKNGTQWKATLPVQML